MPKNNIITPIYKVNNRLYHSITQNRFNILIKSYKD